MGKKYTYINNNLVICHIYINKQACEDIQFKYEHIYLSIQPVMDGFEYIMRCIYALKEKHCYPQLMKSKCTHNT